MTQVEIGQTWEAPKEGFRLAIKRFVDGVLPGHRIAYGSEDNICMVVTEKGAPLYPDRWKLVDGVVKSTEQRVVDPETGGAKGRKPERYELLPFEALDEVARVYAMGAQKYEPNNWRKGYAWGLSLGALLRHVARFAQGEDLDGESGLSHLAHAAFHCLTLLTFRSRGLGKDDRPTKGTT